MKAAKQGRRIKPYFGAGFDEVGEMFSVFTPKRWELIGALRESGAITVARCGTCAIFECEAVNAARSKSSARSPTS